MRIELFCAQLCDKATDQYLYFERSVIQMKIRMTRKKILTAVIISAIFLSVFLGSCSTKPLNAGDDTPLSIQWINGTYAVLTKVNSDDVTVFGGMAHNFLNKQIILASLEEWWGVTTKAEMDEMIDSLAIGRHNPMFLQEAEEYGIIYMSESEFQEALKEVDKRLDVIYFQNMFDAYQKFGENAISAWDLSRAVQLCADGYIADFYSYEEATNKAIKIGEQIQSTFNSWDDFYESYLFGYAYWSEDDTDDPNSNYAQRVEILSQLKEDDKSPLHLDWNLDLFE